MASLGNPIGVWRSPFFQIALCCLTPTRLGNVNVQEIKVSVLLLHTWTSADYVALVMQVFLRILSQVPINLGLMGKACALIGLSIKEVKWEVFELGI